MSSNGSLKVLDHSMSGQFGVDNCNKFIDILGLRTIFPLFMKTPKKSKRRTLTVEEHEGKSSDSIFIRGPKDECQLRIFPSAEHVISIISSMLRHCRGTQRQRLLAKFTENDHEKVDRLLELHFKYLEKIELIDREIESTERVKIDYNLNCGTA